MHRAFSCENQRQHTLSRAYRSVTKSKSACPNPLPSSVVWEVLVLDTMVRMSNPKAATMETSSWPSIKLSPPSVPAECQQTNKTIRSRKCCKNAKSNTCSHAAARIAKFNPHRLRTMILGIPHNFCQVECGAVFRCPETEFALIITERSGTPYHLR